MLGCFQQAAQDLLANHPHGFCVLASTVTLTPVLITLMFLALFKLLMTSKIEIFLNLNHELFLRMLNVATGTLWAGVIVTRLIVKGTTCNPKIATTYTNNKIGLNVTQEYFERETKVLSYIPVDSFIMITAAFFYVLSLVMKAVKNPIRKRIVKNQIAPSRILNALQSCVRDETTSEAREAEVGDACSVVSHPATISLQLPTSRPVAQDTGSKEGTGRKDEIGIALQQINTRPPNAALCSQADHCCPHLMNEASASALPLSVIWVKTSKGVSDEEAQLVHLVTSPAGFLARPQVQDLPTVTEPEMMETTKTNKLNEGAVCSSPPILSTSSIRFPTFAIPWSPLTLTPVLSAGAPELFQYRPASPPASPSSSPTKPKDQSSKMSFAFLVLIAIVIIVYTVFGQKSFKVLYILTRLVFQCLPMYWVLMVDECYELSRRRIKTWLADIFQMYWD